MSLAQKLACFAILLESVRKYSPDWWRMLRAINLMDGQQGQMGIAG
jgi:hypothetical protein